MAVKFAKYSICIFRGNSACPSTRFRFIVCILCPRFQSASQKWARSKWMGDCYYWVVANTNPDRYRNVAMADLDDGGSIRWWAVTVLKLAPNEMKFYVHEVTSGSVVDTEFHLNPSSLLRDFQYLQIAVKSQFYAWFARCSSVTTVCVLTNEQNVFRRKSSSDYR